MTTPKRRKRTSFRHEPVAAPAAPTPRVAVYVRVSTEEQAQSGYSIAAQLEKLEGMCRAQGWDMLPAYVDDGCSGKDMDRPAVQRLIEDAKRRAFDFVLLYKLDRLSRRLGDLISLGEMLERLGIGLRSMTEPFDTTYPAGKLLFNMLGSFAQFERELIGERTRLGLRRRLKEGKWNGLPPFGYRRNGDLLELHPGEAPFAKRVFSLFLEERLGITMIARRMRQEDQATRRRGGKWHRNSVWNMLTSPVYAGKVLIGAEWQKGSHPALVSEEQFTQIQAGLRSNALTPSEQLHSPNILTGLLKCGRCGRTMTVAKGKKRYYYYACARRIEDRSCGLEYIPARALEATILDELGKVASEPGVIERALAELRAQDGDVVDRVRAERLAVQNRLEGMLRAKDARVRWLAESLPQKSVAEEVGREIERQLGDIAGLQRKLAELDRKLRDLESHGANARQVAAFLRRFTDGFGGLSAPQKRLMITTLVAKVVVRSRHDAKVTFTIPLTGLPKQETGPRRAPSLDERPYAKVPLELLATGGPGYPLGLKMLRR